jgi:hypothetical protein
MSGARRVSPTGMGSWRGDADEGRPPAALTPRGVYRPGGKQHIQRTGATIYLARRHIRKHGSHSPQDAAHGPLQYRPPMARTQALSVDNPYTPYVTFQSVGQERPQLLLRFWHCKAVQVDFRLDTVLSTSQLTEDTALHAFPGEDQFLAARKLRVAYVRLKALLQHREPVGARKACARRRAGSFWSRNVRREPLDVAHRFAEEVGIVLVELRLHTTSAESRQNSIVTRLLLAPAPGQCSPLCI